MRIPFGYPLLGEEEKKSVQNVLNGTVLAHGPKVDKFENNFSEYTLSKNSISVSSCTAGMHLIYINLGYGPGDEVIVPAQTHVSTAHAVALTGAKPIFVDCELNTGNIDIIKIERSITSKTKAIAVVHFLGIPVDMIAINKIAKKYNLFVLEDCALALGTKINNRHVGLHGDAGVFSFYPVKHITTAEGGMIILKDKKIAEQIKLQKAFGVDKSYDKRKLQGVYNVVSLGLNYRMSEIHASIGIEQLKKLPKFIEKRRKNFYMLKKNLSDLEEITILDSSNKAFKVSNYCMSVILKNSLAKKRNIIMEKLKKKGIGTSIYYPHPLPRLQYYQSKKVYNSRDFLNAETIADKSIALPVGPHLDTKDMKIISIELKGILRQF